MDNFDLDAFADLQQRLKSSADATRPEFSPELHERILAAIDDCEMLPLHSWSTRLRRPLAIAASLLAIVTGGVLAGYSLTGGFRHATHGASGGDLSSFNETVSQTGALTPLDSEMMQRALAAADHWGWLDEDSRDEAAWFVADMPLDPDSFDAPAPDATAPEADDEASLGS